MHFFLRMRIFENKFKEIMLKIENGEIEPKLTEIKHFSLDPFTIICFSEANSLEELDAELDNLREYAEIEEVAEIINTEEAKAEVSEYI